MQLTITAASTALFSTWFFLEELDLLFDAGDGVTAALGQRSGKIKQVFITHADRDHVCGLLQLHQLNARHGVPHIYYPCDCGSFPALRDFMHRFDPQSGPASWTGLGPDEIVGLPNGYSVKTRTSKHVRADPGVTKALEFTLSRTRRTLRKELRGLSESEIVARKKEVGEAGITEEVSEKVIGYSGDTPGLEPAHWKGVEVLIHEATFLQPDTSRGAHSNLPQVISAARELELKALILFHFSSRYGTAEIEDAIREEADESKPSFPIYAILPGRISHDILGSAPVWSPSDS